MSLAMRNLALVSLLLAPGAAAQTAAPLALNGATVYPAPDQPAIRNAVILLRGGRIAAVGPRGSVTVPPGTDTLDCTGLTVTAGFWNTHVHFGERKWSRAAELPPAEASEQLGQMLTGHGFTHVFDTGSPLENTLALRVLFGTDVGYVLDYDPAEEFALMAQAGLSFADLLASLTTNPARRFGLEAKTGRVAPGMEADLVVLEGDPAHDIRALARVRYTVRQGRIIYRRHTMSP